MKNILYTLLLLSFAMAGCSDDSTDYESGSIVPIVDGLFVNDWGKSTETTFTTSNIVSVSLYDYPDGWEVDIIRPLNGENRLVVTAPNDDSGEATGDVVLLGTTPNGSSSYKYIEVGVVDFIRLDDQQSNSMCVGKDGAGKFYTFNPRLRGEETVESINPTDCRQLWRTTGSTFDYVQMVVENEGEEPRIGFYLQYDEYDYDDDDDETDVIGGNGVITAINDDEEVLWSWHIWVSDNGYDEFAVDGTTFMDRNIGARDNNNTDTDEIMDSYGLYYQWGRKDPFVYGTDYKLSGAANAYLYDGFGSLTYVEVEELSDGTGDIEYTILYPNYFIKGDNWLSNIDDTLWGDGSTKTLYDPCPKGWRVPTLAELEKLGTTATEAIGDSETINYVNYGANFADANDALIMACGYKAYLDGKLLNISQDGTYEPWSGYYWSSDAGTGNYAPAFNFYLNYDADVNSRSISVDYNTQFRRANGMQIRCVKM